MKTSFPKDARLDYKILVGKANWILDPGNPYQQWSGVGGGSPNSELRMPEWKPDPITQSPLPGATSGKVERDLLFNSDVLGYQVNYNVYLPNAYNPTKRYPILYVTDGYEYMHERMGNMVTIVDNLTFTERIQPVIVIFIDHREPVNRSNNCRMQELAMNEKYLRFITDELVPSIESRYKVTTAPEHRGVIGTSMGGLSSAFFSFSTPALFGLAGIQSPAFWFKPEIYTLCAEPEHPPVKIFMSTGTINDTAEGALKMKALLEQNTCVFEYREVNQGHSWGNWRDLIDDMLIYFLPFEKMD